MRFVWVCLTVLLVNSALASDWPQWRGINRDALSTEKDWFKPWPKEGPRVVWKAAVGTGSSGVSISNGKAYTMGWVKGATPKDGNDTVFCLDANTGAEVWKYSYPAQSFANDHEGGPGSTPTCDGERVYTLSKGGKFHALDATKGTLVWSKDFVADFKGAPPYYGYSAGPLLNNEMLIVMPGGEGASTVALDRKTGKVLWQVGSDKSAYASPILFDYNGKTLLAVYGFNGLVIHDPADGKELARFEWITKNPRGSSINAATPIYLNGHFFISSGYNHGCVMLKFSGDSLKPVWQGTQLRSMYAGALLLDGHLYGLDCNNEFINGKGTLNCVDFMTGEIKWSDKRIGWGGVIAADNKLIIYDRKGELIITEASTKGYTELARAQVMSGITRTDPSFAHGKLYLRNVTGDVWCVDLKNP